MPGNSNAYWQNVPITATAPADTTTLIATVKNVVVSEYQRNLQVLAWVSWSADENPVSGSYALGYDSSNGGSTFTGSPTISYAGSIVGVTAAGTLQLDPGIHEIDIIFSNNDATATVTIESLWILVLVGD